MVQNTLHRALRFASPWPLATGSSRGALPLFAAVALVAATGCTSRTQTFEGYSDDQVWSAMVAVSRAPEYDDWKIADNDVFVDEAGRRIEVYRRLRRLYVSPYSEPRKEDEEWRLQMMLERDDSLDAPTVEFTTRQVTVPAHVWREADRFFAQVRALLGPVEEPTDEPESAEPDRGMDDGETLSDEEVPTPPPLPELD
ncbi:MAG: hypothetical protein GC172_06755 [Phycisphaera sp.]|nr:hypothetical protein [Phycisphaera sp.]